MFCGVGSGEESVLVSAGSAEVASVLLQWLQDTARVPAGTAILQADGVTIQLEPKALKSLTWFNIRDDDVDKTALSVNSACFLLPHTTPYDVKINLKEKPDTKAVKELLSSSGRVIAEGGAIELQLYHHWRNVCSGESDIFLQSLLSAQPRRGSIRRLRGCLSSWGIKQLPDSLEKLGLALCCPDHSHQVIHALKDLALPNLDTLRIHIRSGSLALEHLAPLIAPAQEYRGAGLVVYISRVLDSDVTWVANALKAMQPPGGKIQSLQLPTCELSVDGYELCLRSMVTEGIALQGVVMQSSKINNQADVSKLETLTSQYFQGTKFMLHDNNDALDF